MSSKPTFTRDWFSQSEVVFETILKNFKGRDNQTFLEIGSFEGRSAIWMLDNILTGKNCKIICIDAFKGSPSLSRAGVSLDGARELFLQNMEAYKGRYRLIEGASQDVLRTREFDDLIDVAYIDGSHTAANALSDLVLVYNLIKPGGIIFLDDYMWNYNTLPAHETPKVAIDAFMECYRSRVMYLYVDRKTVVLRKNA